MAVLFNVKIASKSTKNGTDFDTKSYFIRQNLYVGKYNAYWIIEKQIW